MPTKHPKQVRSEYINAGTSEKISTRTDDELRADYMATFVKYALRGVAMKHPETVPIFEKKSRQPRRLKEVTI